MLKVPRPYQQGLPHQENNDRWICEIVFPGKRQGYFVEIGAATGLTISSCYVLEKMGWRGICVEPSAEFFPQLVQNRPRSICENICISEQSGMVRFKEGAYGSRIVRGTAQGLGPDERMMPSLSLLDLLRKHQVPPVIDFLAMDCEGSDAAILNAFDFSAYQILAISLEGDAPEVLKANGFVKVVNPRNRKCPWESNYVSSIDPVALKRAGTALY